jgi:ABC-2 type transport system permease protein
VTVSSQSVAAGRPPTIAGELGKLGAFVRRDIVIGLSYRTAFVSAIGGLALQVLVLSWIGKLIRPESLPEFGGVHVSYMAFVTIGLAVNLAGATLLYRVATQLRNEQLIGTLEALLCTPTAIWTLQLGTAIGSLLMIPVRMGVFLGVLALAFGLHYDASGFLPAVVLTASFVPCLWGIGLGVAGAVLTFRRGHGVTALGTAALSLTSGAFFPLSVLPHWLGSIAAVNPLTIAIRGLRDALLGGTGWAGVGGHLLVLAPMSVASLLLGAVAFRLALARERRNGTLGTY